MSAGAGNDRIEYGVICDRTEVGLGMALLATYGDMDTAFASAHRYDEQCVLQHDHRHLVKWRTVRTFEWSSPIWSDEHIGGCNENCTPTSHHLGAAR